MASIDINDMTEDQLREEATKLLAQRQEKKIKMAQRNKERRIREKALLELASQRGLVQPNAKA